MRNLLSTLNGRWNRIFDAGMIGHVVEIRKSRDGAHGESEDRRESMIIVAA